MHFALFYVNTSIIKIAIPPIFRWSFIFQKSESISGCNLWYKELRLLEVCGLWQLWSLLSLGLVTLILLKFGDQQNVLGSRHPQGFKTYKMLVNMFYDQAKVVGVRILVLRHSQTKAYCFCNPLTAPISGINCPISKRFCEKCSLASTAHNQIGTLKLKLPDIRLIILDHTIYICHSNE